MIQGVTLASLTRPPNTSLLVRCDERVTARAIASATSRVLRRREALRTRRASGGVVEKLLLALRRLQNPELAAYQLRDRILLSEPFGAIPCCVEPAPSQEARRIVAALLGRRPPVSLVESLACFGRAALELALWGDVRVRLVTDGMPFAQCSSSVASLVPDIDRWQAPPAGLFVLQERLLLLRGHALRMTAAHEFAHAIDAVLAAKPRSYYSFENLSVRECFACATGFVNEYAASGLDEYFAECLRAYVEVNDDRSSWLPLTRSTLLARDPKMFAVVERLMRDMRR